VAHRWCWWSDDQALAQSNIALTNEGAIILSKISLVYNELLNSGAPSAMRTRVPVPFIIPGAIRSPIQTGSSTESYASRTFGTGEHIALAMNYYPSIVDPTLNNYVFQFTANHPFLYLVDTNPRSGANRHSRSIWKIPLKIETYDARRHL
jgi:hypothetical protein